VIGGANVKGGRKGKKSTKVDGVKSGGVEESVGQTTHVTATSKDGEKWVIVEIPGGHEIRAVSEFTKMEKSRNVGEGGLKEVGMGEVTAQPANILDSSVLGPMNFGSYKLELTAMGEGESKGKKK
jgi:hypothetical protein